MPNNLFLSSAPRGFSSIYVSDEVRLLVDRASAVARTPRERRLFSSIIRRSREEALELEILYRDLPGVLAGRENARLNFLQTLDRAVSLGVGEPFAGEMVGVSAFQHLVPCSDAPQKASFVVRPEVILQLVSGIEALTRGDDATYRLYIDALFRLWARTRRIDDLLTKAKQGASAGGRDRLAEELQLVARDLEGQLQFVPEPPGNPPFADGLEGFPPPDDGAPWPGPDDGPPIPMPGGGKGPPIPGGGLPGPGGRPPGPGDLQEDMCRRLIQAGASGLRDPQVPTSTWADGISLLTPNPACPGEELHIVGTGFGAVQPQYVIVLIGDIPAQVSSWTDTEIVVIVPENVRSGCVGFRNESTEAQLQRQLTQRQAALNQIAEGMGCLGLGSIPPMVSEETTFIATLPPCTGLNHFAGTKPEIEAFLVNGTSNAVVEPGTPVILTWDVRNATEIHIRRTSTQGPPIDLTDPPLTSKGLGPFTENRPVDAIYELSAENRCGTVTATLTVKLRKWPKLVIEGIELTQGNQVFWRPGVTWNDIDKVAGKDTIARVYVSVDMGGFQDDEVPGVTGVLVVGGVPLPPFNDTSDGVNPSRGPFIVTS